MILPNEERIQVVTGSSSNIANSRLVDTGFSGHSERYPPQETMIMKDNETVHERVFEHLVLEGTSYEIGKQQGEIYKAKKQSPLKKNKFPKETYFTSGSFNKKKSGYRDFQDILDLHEEHCPGINDEIQGFADSLGVKPEQLAVYDFPISAENNCSQIALLPTVTTDKHFYVARSYDWNYDQEDLCICTTRVKGKVAHVGYATLLFGRMEGLNEKGLCVCMTGGGAWNTPVENKRAFDFWIAVRAVLEKCGNAKEAADLLLTMPVKTSTNYLFADKSGKAVLVEGNDSEFAVKEIDSESTEQFLYSTNHYVMPEMVKYNKFNIPWLIGNSKTRYKTIKEFLEDHLPGKAISKDDLKELLTKEIPDGLCAYWQTDCFGTLWSTVFDVTSGIMETSFGPPSHNDWREFTVDKPDKNGDYTASFIDKRLILEN